MVAIDTRTVDRTGLHRIWKAILIGIACIVFAACYFRPVLLIGVALILLSLVCARLVYKGRDRYIPNLYARDIEVYDDAYRSFIGRTLAELRQCKIGGHTLLWEASRLAPPSADHPDELLLDLGVWAGWSTRLISDASGRTVYGFDTFSGLVEDWPIDDHTVIKRGAFSLADPVARRFLRDTGVSLHDGVPDALGRKVEFIRGSTYETLAPFLAERPGAAIRLFHMDLDTYESCVHALETCKDRFVEGSILVFDEYLVTNGEMLAFYEFQSKYELQWHYRAWGLEAWEMNLEMVTARPKRAVYYLITMALHWTIGGGSYAWTIFRKRFWRFWLGAPIADMLFMLGAAGQRKSVSLEITGLGKLDRRRPADRNELV
ncbi:MULTISPECIES: class I SAM-dependent methyltransferase [Mycobacterium avium complex (MAC)]|uniref:Class I SAM-dependent methyltransferase n=1 Tax=Mycobacterium intracellulare TaxID=1767 RepID=A0AAE4UFK1_MYCIT|nr:MULTISPECIES: class I SAM-dependent methyltransferase [Mycobacterium avium complex (MAC)]MCA2319634.1 class I SAM-dependent methyltransferase [Mycobacterium intracellulare]MCA2340147.1 class I SAM-dependent methyltransferase [Mycobacterium intracellulare]MDV6976342.1 class I SAM-dependent methyltransferase [Mycobacterium intracellulare]MDV6981395.1 class I SAM-dependent methyltransferase [Mycobacterium intracellulare]MDV7015313.1 class I SAM-dependent methyltransferase [Mycobacterium intrac